MYLKILLNLNFFSWRLAHEESIRNHSSIDLVGSCAEFIERYVDNDMKVLDIGCSLGKWSRFCAQLGADVRGVDQDLQAIRDATAFSPKGNPSYDCADAVTYVEELAKSNCEEFDLALLFHILEHLDDPAALLKNLNRLVSGILIEVPDFESSGLNFVRLKLQQPFFSDGDHVREYTIDSLTDLISGTGWKLKEAKKNKGAITAFATKL